MRVSFRDFHLQYEPSLKRERIPEHMFQLLGPPASPKPVFEPAPAQQATASTAADASTVAAAGADAAQPDGTAQGTDAADAAAPLEAAAEQQVPQTEAVPQLALDLLQQVSFAQQRNIMSVYIHAGRHAVHVTLRHVYFTLMLVPCCAMLCAKSQVTLKHKATRCPLIPHALCNFLTAKM